MAHGDRGLDLRRALAGRVRDQAGVRGSSHRPVHPESGTGSASPGGSAGPSGSRCGTHRGEPRRALDEGGWPDGRREPRPAPPGGATARVEVVWVPRAADGGGLVWTTSRSLTRAAARGHRRPNRRSSGWRRPERSSDRSSTSAADGRERALYLAERGTSAGRRPGSRRDRASARQGRGSRPQATFRAWDALRPSSPVERSTRRSTSACSTRSRTSVGSRRRRPRGAPAGGHLFMLCWSDRKPWPGRGASAGARSAPRSAGRGSWAIEPAMLRASSARRSDWLARLRRD
jgi:hypothetical protein